MNEIDIFLVVETAEGKRQMADEGDAFLGSRLLLRAGQTWVNALLGSRLMIYS